MKGGRSNISDGGGRHGERRGQHQGQGGQGRGINLVRPNEGGGRGQGEAPPPIRRPSGQMPDSWPPVQVNYPLPQRALTSSSPQPRQSAPSPVGASSRGAGVWTGASTSTVTPVQPPQSASSPVGSSSRRARIMFGSVETLLTSTATPVQHAQSASSPVGASSQGAGVGTGTRLLSAAGHQPPEAAAINLQTLKITEKTPQEDQIEVIRRPDRGGRSATRTINLLVNHFRVAYREQSTILHYDVDVKPCGDTGLLQRKLRKSEMALIKVKLFSKQDEFRTALEKTVYDAEKNVFSAVPLPEGEFKVEIPEGEEVRRGTYTFTIKLVNELKLSKLRSYLTGKCTSVPRDILQGMDLVMKDNPSRRRIAVGRSFYSHAQESDLPRGLAAHGGFKHSLKCTSTGLTLCLDYSVIAFRKECSVIEYLTAHVMGFRGVRDVKRLIGDVVDALKGLKVSVNHRRTKQKYTIAGLTEENARGIYFDLIDPEGLNPPTTTCLLDYFREKWGKDVKHKDIPCLDLGNPRKPNYVPMEFCKLVEGQRYPSEKLEKLDPHAARALKDFSLCKPSVRRNIINDMVQAGDGPTGNVVSNFGIDVNQHMLNVPGRVIHPPKLKLGGEKSVTVDPNICHWNFREGYFMEGIPIRRWALIDFTKGERKNQLNKDPFIGALIDRFDQLGIRMEKPLAQRLTQMQEFSSIERLENLLKSVMQEATTNGGKEKLQLIVCVMSSKDNGYKLLKWVSETKLGVVTQCCLSYNVNKRQDQILSNLCLKINAKLGGSNFELKNGLVNFRANDHVMFIGADVNHPAAGNLTSPSIAAVVGTVNWPAANRYAARVGPQTHRVEQIANFGDMCLDLVKAYAQANNNVRPNKIVLFRDGVSEGQFEMVLRQELHDLKRSICNDNYDPSITVVVAQKRHQTRLFDEVGDKNVPPGTVVDTHIVSPQDFDFYLCSHYGGMGTSKPTHYYVLWDENGFSSDGLQKLIYHMCYTFVRCTKPVSLVPPVYYADLVAYRGRMFQEVVVQNQHHGLASHDTPSSGSTPPALTNDASFDQSFYNVHQDLKDVMFFV